MCIENISFHESEVLRLATGASVIADLDLISEDRV
jgi:hypothetical protein